MFLVPIHVCKHWQTGQHHMRGRVSLRGARCKQRRMHAPDAQLRQHGNSCSSPRSFSHSPPLLTGYYYLLVYKLLNELLPSAAAHVGPTRGSPAVESRASNCQNRELMCGSPGPRLCLPHNRQPASPTWGCSLLGWPCFSNIHGYAAHTHRMTSPPFPHRIRHPTPSFSDE